MKTQNTKLVFTKNSLLELNNEDLKSINGGSWPDSAFDLIGQAAGYVYDAGVAVGGAIVRAIED